MATRLQADVRRETLRVAREEAEAVGSLTIEAEHLLLALAARGSDPAGRLLADAGLDPAGIRAALERETEQSLAAVGIAVEDFAGWPVSAAPRRGAKLAASSKRALIRAVGVARAGGHRTITGPHLLIGILGADRGTVPRALDAAGVDRGALSVEAARQISSPTGR